MNVADDRTDEFQRMLAVRRVGRRVVKRDTLKRERKTIDSTGLSRLYTRFITSPVERTREPLIDALRLAQRDARNEAELSHLLVVNEMVHALDDSHRIAQIDERASHLRAPQFELTQRGVPRWLAMNEVERQLERVETTLGFVSTLIQRHERSIARIEEGAETMKSRTDAAAHALGRIRIGSTRAYLIKFTALLSCFVVTMMLLLFV